MIKEIRYKNFKALRDTTLPLGRFTLIVGANGTGKSSALQALKWISIARPETISQVLSSGLNPDYDAIEINILWEKNSDLKNLKFFSSPKIYSDILMSWRISNFTGKTQLSFDFEGVQGVKDEISNELEEIIGTFKIFSFDANKISESVSIRTKTEFDSFGKNLAGVLDQFRDNEPEKFEQLNSELNRWFPEFDRILFEVPEEGKKSFLLRTRIGKHKIKAEDLSDGTRLALAYLTIAYLPNPPKIVAFEEPEKGIHPRLLENIQEAMYRLAYPENYGETREPIQVIATTHSPYLLDLYKDYPEEIVIASKDEKGVQFERLIDKPHFEEVIQDAPLGEVWYTGVLGGVPVQP